MQAAPLSRLSTGDAIYRRLDELCEVDAQHASREERVFWFVQLAAWIRGDQRDRAAARLRYLNEHLQQQPSWLENVRSAIGSLVSDWDLVELLAYGGIPRDFHFAGAVKEWLAFRLLPAACDSRNAPAMIVMAFEESDTKWLDDPTLGALAGRLLDGDQVARLKRAVCEAMINLSHQLTAQAHSPAIAGLSRVATSPFRSLHTATEAFVEEPEDDARYERLFSLIARCRMDVTAEERKLMVRGADLNTTFQLDRMFQQLARLQQLASVAYSCDAGAVARTCAALVQAILRNTSGKRLLRRSSQLWIRNLVDTAASVGRNYLAPESSSWRAAFLAGAGGGFLMAFATVFKYLISAWQLPTVYQGFAFGLNYGAAFCAAYLLHFTIATKLPANTAAALVQSVHERGGHLRRMSRFMFVWRALVRLQLAGLLGNVLVAGPVAYALDRLASATLHEHLLDVQTAEHVLHANSLLGPSALYAALTGVLLWLSSLIAAGADNWTRVVGLEARLATNLRVLRHGSPARARARARAWVPRLGGLTGNLALGFMLGTVPAFFAVFQLPVDIRHVTVSAASWALALARGTGSSQELLLSAAGVLVIGAVNVVVSFMLALHVALEASARRGRNADDRLIVRVALSRWLRGKAKARSAVWGDEVSRTTIEPVA